MSTSAPALPPSDHCDGTRFFNPGLDTDKSLWDVLRWQRTSQRAAWPRHRANRPYPPPPERLGPGEVAVTFVGHATFLIRIGGCTILTDPLFSQRASPLRFAGPRRVRDPGLRLDDLPPLDLILLSHNHYDHMDLPALRRLRSGTAAPILTGLGNAAYLARKGVGKAVDLDWWQTIEHDGLRITFVPAQHWSSRSLSDRRQTLWGGFFVEAGAATLYFAGDSGYCPWFRMIRERCGAPDLALLPIGAYEPRWFMQSQHMNPTEAVRAHLDLGARRSIGMHFGTIQLTDEAIDEPLRALAQAKGDAGLPDVAFMALDVGESLVVSPA